MFRYLRAGQELCGFVRSGYQASCRNWLIGPGDKNSRRHGAVLMLKMSVVVYHKLKRYEINNEIDSVPALISSNQRLQ